ncbi:protein of unknown function [Micromonospora nigra]|uniref:DarT domain-containing protein n=1 Tax=Micromonospora nigra TaxID=145857 RepID=A0A1C6SGK0_9ACTN|nr:DUF4433 domain-containing protein [Micromonospora nigra]SCL28590.1 protein of unknown function [Micromonospora nigra]
MSTNTLILHFTHVDNLPGILAAGRLFPDGAVGQRLATDVGAIDIKARRRSRPVPCLPGGFVSDYVPFYFAGRSPMMYRIACEHRDGVVGRYPDGDRVRRRSAEFLVHREFPLDLLTGYAVRTQERREQVTRVLRTAGIIDAYVGVRGDWYYGYRRGEVR